MFTPVTIDEILEASSALDPTHPRGRPAASPQAQIDFAPRPGSVRAIRKSFGIKRHRYA